ncbi:MAG: DHH family phosphoesterase [Patescibacteria group bacterium]|jgi:phosphoesterase RecJ-like protein
MTQNIALQIREQITQSKKILITTRQQATGDGLSSCLALFLFLKKINKNAEVVINGFKLPDNLSFLPAVQEVKNEVKRLKKFIINLDISQTGIEALNYDIAGNNLRIHLTPKFGVFNADDVKLENSRFTFDLIIALDTPDLEGLGKLYDFHRDIFYQLPVINIDHSPANEQYGHFNLIDVTRASTAEIVYQLINEWQPTLLDQAMATCLLAGLISKTKSFKTNQVNPAALKVAGELINLGANRKEIVTHLYQTKTIATLKLWGKILGRLQADAGSKIVWSKLDLHDFTESGATEKDIAGVIEELIASSPLSQIIILFYQLGLNQTKVILHTQNLTNALGLIKQFNPTGDKNNAIVVLDLGIDQAEKIILETIKAQII